LVTIVSFTVPNPEVVVTTSDVSKVKSGAMLLFSLPKVVLSAVFLTFKVILYPVVLYLKSLLPSKILTTSSNTSLIGKILPGEVVFATQ